MSSAVALRFGDHAASVILNSFQDLLLIQDIEIMRFWELISVWCACSQWRFPVSKSLLFWYNTSIDSSRGRENVP